MSLPPEISIHPALHNTEKRLGLQPILCLDGAAQGAQDLFSVLAGESEEFTPVETLADDPCLMI